MHQIKHEFTFSPGDVVCMVEPEPKYKMGGISLYDIGTVDGPTRRGIAVSFAEQRMWLGITPEFMPAKVEINGFIYSLDVAALSQDIP